MIKFGIVRKDFIFRSIMSMVKVIISKIIFRDFFINIVVLAMVNLISFRNFIVVSKVGWWWIYLEIFFIKVYNIFKIIDVRSKYLVVFFFILFLKDELLRKYRRLSRNLN